MKSIKNGNDEKDKELGETKTPSEISLDNSDKTLRYEEIGDRDINGAIKTTMGYNVRDKIAGRYSINQLIGEGAFGKVYLAYDELLCRNVAVKVLLGNIIHSENLALKEAFLLEARIIAKLDHFNIVPIYDAGIDEDIPWIVMKYIKAISLEEMLLKNGKFSIENSVELTIQILNGLSYAHKRDVIHRDIKPANILISKDDDTYHIWIADFGIAKVMSDKTLGSENVIVGTPCYMSPEQITGRKVDTRADLFAVGCIFYEMLTGKRAYRGSSISEIAYKIVHEQPPELKELAKTLNKEVVEFICRAIAKSPQDRYQNAEEMIVNLKSLICKGKIKKRESNIFRVLFSTKLIRWDEEYPLIIEDLYKSYHFRKYVLKGINLRIKRASIYALLGRNGSGKTTLIQTILGILQPDKGVISFFGRNPSKGNKEILSRIGYVPEFINAYEWMKISDLISFLKRFYPNWDDSYCYNLLSRFALPLDERIKSLSKGMKTKVSLLHALSHKPEFLLLDDPTIGLDAIVSNEVFEAINEAAKQWGTTVFLASHNLEEVEHIACNVSFIKDGELLITDTIDQLKMKICEIKLEFSNEIPKINIENFKLINISDRKITGIIMDTSSGTLEKLKKFNPAKIEIRELSLKEIFINFLK